MACATEGDASLQVSSLEGLGRFWGSGFRGFVVEGFRVFGGLGVVCFFFFSGLGLRVSPRALEPLSPKTL